MGDNPIGQGFRVHRLPGNLSVVECIVATAQSFDVYNGASNVILRAGDPIYGLSTGGLALAAGSESSGGTATAPWGIVQTVGPYYDVVSGRMVQGEGLPSDVAWGTNLALQSKVGVLPVEGAIFEVDVDDKVTATTLATYQALINENCDHKLCGASGGKYALPRLDISGHATTSTLVWRIVGISPSCSNIDYSESYVKLLVKANVIGDAPFTATGV